jgi:hypothetical protein
MRDNTLQQMANATSRRELVTTISVSNDLIAALAYELWQARGCPHGSPEADWLQAEDQLRGRIGLDVSLAT